MFPLPFESRQHRGKPGLLEREFHYWGLLPQKPYSMFQPNKAWSIAGHGTESLIAAMVILALVLLGLWLQAAPSHWPGCHSPISPTPTSLLEAWKSCVQPPKASENRKTSLLVSRRKLEVTYYALRRPSEGIKTSLLVSSMKPEVMFFGPLRTLQGFWRVGEAVCGFFGTSECLWGERPSGGGPQFSVPAD